MKFVEVAQIIASLDNQAAGTSYSVRRLTEALRRRGIHSDILSTGVVAGPAGSSAFAQNLATVPLIGQMRFSRGLQDAIDQRARNGAILHAHGLWLMPNVYPGWSAKRHSRPLIVSPRGMLGAAALKFSSVKKRLFWKMLQHKALSVAKCLHATSRQEYDDIRTFGIDAPVAIIPNGVDLVSSEAGVENCATSSMRAALYLGRLHPKKGLRNLLEAWALVEPVRRDWQLKIVGPSERGFGDELRRIARSIKLQNVIFEDAAYGEAKRRAYRQAEFFVMPTANENFGLTVAEALAEATPVICTIGAPWRGLVEHRCGWWIDHGVVPLQAALLEATATAKDDLIQMGARGQKWVRKEFAWEQIAADMEAVYDWSVGAADPPSCLIFD